MFGPPSPTRRTVIKATGTAIVAVAISGRASAQSEWTSEQSPTGNTLYDVVYTDSGAYAVGGGGIVLERDSGNWQKILDGGPTGNGNSLYGADVTDDGKRLWFVGSSGAIGEYDVTTGNLEDYSAPQDVTNRFNDVSVRGDADQANVYVAGDSGQMYVSFENGVEGSWDNTTPGSGSEINAVDFHDARSGHIVDGNQTVFSTSDGTTWSKFGIEDANENFYGVDSDGSDDVWISGGGGMIYHWDGAKWTPTDTGDATLRDIEVTDADTDGYAVGSSGAVYDFDGTDWVQEQTPSGENLKAIARGDPNITVGAGGTITVMTGSSSDSVTLPGENSPAQSLDGDELLEDVDGDGDGDVADVLTYYNNRDSDTIKDNPDKFDFDQDGSPGTVFDALELYNKISQL